VGGSRNWQSRRLLGVAMKPFEQVVTEHGPTVLRVCRAILGPHEAEDAWSETFLSALRAYPDLPGGSNIRAWLVTIAKRKAIDQHRARSRQPMPAGELPDQPATDRYPADCDDTLWAALEALPRRQREAIAYHHLAGMPYAQVGELLGNTESAARRAAADGMRTLRNHYRGAAS